jgi:hypothetical protein
MAMKATESILKFPAKKSVISTARTLGNETITYLSLRTKPYKQK